MVVMTITWQALPPDKQEHGGDAQLLQLAESLAQWVEEMNKDFKVNIVRSPVEFFVQTRPRLSTDVHHPERSDFAGSRLAFEIVRGHIISWLARQLTTGDTSIINDCDSQPMVRLLVDFPGDVIAANVRYQW